MSTRRPGRWQLRDRAAPFQKAPTVPDSRWYPFAVFKTPKSRSDAIVRDLTLAILLGVSLGSCFAQSQSSKPPEPATIGDVFLLDSANQKLTPLPREEWKAIGKPGWTTATGAIQISGETSSLRIKAGDQTAFVFNVGNPESVRLYELTRKKNKREFEIVKVKSGFHPERKTLEGIAADLTKYGDSSYKLAPKSPLAAGEYAIDVSGKMFTFGID